MLKIIEFGRKTAPDIIYLKTHCLIVRMKILLMGCLFGKMKNFKHIIPFLMTLLFLATPNIFWAQDSNRPWIPDGENFQITRNLRDHFLPSVASNGDIYFAVWYVSTPSGFDIYGARITKEGEVLDEEEIPICTAPNDQMFSSIAWDGVNFFVVWQDRRNGKRWDIYGTRISIDGEVLDPKGIPIGVGKSLNDQVAPVVAFDGENYMVVWQGKRNAKLWNIYFTKVSRHGEVLDNKPILLSPSLKNQASPAVTFDGENYFIVWQDYRSGKFWDIYGARVNPSGEIIDNKDFTISPTFEGDISGFDKWRPVVSWDGSFFLVIWVVSRQEQKWRLEGKRVTEDGQVVDLLDIPIQENSKNKIFPALLWDEDQYVLVWEEEPEGESKIFGSFILPQYKPFIQSEPIRLSALEAKDHSLPAVSKVEDGILVIWQGKGLEGYRHIYGQRLRKQVEAPLVQAASGG